jgi:hypothetical protein
VLTVVAAIIGLALFAFWIRGSSVAAFLMIVPSFLLACAIWVQPMLSEPGFVRLGPAHEWALFEAGVAGFIFAFLPCIVKWQRDDLARERERKAMAAAAAAGEWPREPLELLRGSHPPRRG